MKRAVYYFSGTGNSLCVARDLAALLNAELVPIARYREQDAVETDAEQIGLVFPVYYGELPVLVREFAGKLRDLKSKRVFAVCTYGGAAMDSLRSLRKLLEEYGGRLSLAFGVPMPQNSFPKWYESRRRRIAAQPKACRKIARLVEDGAAGIRYHNGLLEWLMIPVTKYLVKPACEKMFSRASGLPEGSSAVRMMRRMDRNFAVLEPCNGCGTCAKVCPVQNIVLENGKPVWQGRCEHCLACYSFCPRQAIAGGITHKGYFYRHPGVTLKDFLGTP